MNRENKEQLTEGYESALETVTDLEETVAEMQDTVADALSELQGEIRILITTMKECLRCLHHLPDDRIA